MISNNYYNNVTSPTGLIELIMALETKEKAIRMFNEWKRKLEKREMKVKKLCHGRCTGMNSLTEYRELNFKDWKKYIYKDDNRYSCNCVKKGVGEA